MQRGSAQTMWGRALARPAERCSATIVELHSTGQPSAAVVTR